MDTLHPTPGAWKILRIWTSISLQSFGGGASTVLLIQRTFIDKYQWLTMEEYTKYWVLCTFTPGINLLALTVLIGRKLGGTPGIIASLAGLVIPSAFITCLIAAGFQLIQGIHEVQAVLRGIIPATAGILLLVGLRFSQPLIQQAYKEGALQLSYSLLVILAAACAVIVLKLSVIPVLLGTALLTMLIFTSWRIKTVVLHEPAQEEKEPSHD